MSAPLQGKVAMVTGSSRGIGKAIALQLAVEGAAVAVCARSESSTPELPGSIHETVVQIEASGGTALAIRLDVTDEESIKDSVRQALSHFGTIDILVNNAAWQPALDYKGTSYLEGDVSALDRSYSTNVRAPFLLGQLAGASMAAHGGGVIINMTSQAGQHRLPPGHPNLRPSVVSLAGQEYAASKAALDRLSTGLAHELLPFNIAVLSLNPGLVATERLALQPIAGIDMSRAVSPELIARAVAFICQHPMDFTGQLVFAREVVDQNRL